MLMRSPEVWEHPGVPLPQENTLGRNLPYNKTPHPLSAVLKKQPVFKKGTKNQ
jgi:hypothetical protein